MAIKDENHVVKNKRPNDHLDEREAYEELCRQTEAKVKDHFS